MSRCPAVVLIAFAVLALASGCDRAPSSRAEEPGTKTEASQKGEQTGTSRDEQRGEHAHEEEHDHHEGAGDESAKQTTVEVSEEGTTFKPSVAASRIPKEAWHCNMNGKVHYAATKKGDGTCPVCNMDLTRK